MYAIEIKDKWTDWRISSLNGQLFIFAKRKDAIQRMKEWREDKRSQIGIKWAGIKYRIKPLKVL